MKNIKLVEECDRCHTWCDESHITVEDDRVICSSCVDALEYRMV